MDGWFPLSLVGFLLPPYQIPYLQSCSVGEGSGVCVCAFGGGLRSPVLTAGMVPPEKKLAGEASNSTKHKQYFSEQWMELFPC